jgi:hypothetical protein
MIVHVGPMLADAGSGALSYIAWRVAALSGWCDYADFVCWRSLLQLMPGTICT